MTELRGSRRGQQLIPSPELRGSCRGQQLIPSPEGQLSVAVSVPPD